MARYAFIGLGTMGFAMAGNLANQGHRVRAFNRTHSTAQRWLDTYQDKASGELSIHTSASEAAHTSDIVLLCVGNDEHVREQITHPEHGALSSLQAGALIIDHTTTSATIAEHMHQACAQQQVRFADAPVSGGQQGAENGQLVAMVGCEQELWPQVQSAIAPYTAKTARFGDVGCGQKTKMVNQVCIAGLLQGLSEGLLLAQHAGLDGNAVIDLIKGGAAGSWQMSQRSATMLEGEYDHGFAIDWMIKDLGICLDEAKRLNVDLPVTSIVSGYYGELQALGAGQCDTSALLYRLQQHTKRGA